MIYPFYRMVSPASDTMYYSKETAEYVTEGYTKWRRRDWVSSFNVNQVLMDGRIEDDQGRLWEGFGFVVPLYDKGEE